MKNSHQIKAFFFGALFSCSFVPVVMAADTEIYTTPSTTVVNSRPNILFIVDGSSDMLATSVVRDPYDSSISYSGSCNSSRIYYSADGSVPDCGGQNDFYFGFSSLVCKTAVADTAYVLDADGLPTTETEAVDGPLLAEGYYTDNIVNYKQSGNGNNATFAWAITGITRNSQRNNTVECEADNGVHGVDDNSTDKYISDADKYTNTEQNPTIWQDDGARVTLFHSNYINYINDTGVNSTNASYFDQIRTAIAGVVNTVAGVNIGLMVLDQKDSGASDLGSEGGGIMYEMQDGASPRGNFLPQLWSLNAEGTSSLSEAYYEALLYYGGKSVDYGDDASPPLVGSATESGNTEYTSPIELACMKNHIVLTSNGKATGDELSQARQAALGSLSLDADGVPSCSSDLTPSINSDDNRFGVGADGQVDADGKLIPTANENNCLDDLAGWAANNDVAELNIPAHEGIQTVKTHTIGFGYGGLGSDQQAAGEQLLKDTADKGNGTFYKANNAQGLKDVFEKIILDALKDNSTFTSPAVSVNAFNRSTHLDDLYFTLFRPTDNNRWEGNLKKYKLQFYVDVNDDDGDGDRTERLPFIADANGNKAVDPSTGVFIDEPYKARSYWTDPTDPDGSNVTDGGAVSMLSNSRNVYTFTGTYDTTTIPGVSAPTGATGDLTAETNEVVTSNTALTDVLFDVEGYDEYIVGTPYLETITNWTKGLDALSNFGTVADEVTDVRPQMGDPLHGEPALVQYGEIGNGTDGIDPELVSYVVTNDGYLHAIDVADGSEIFSFVPQELLPNIQIAMENDGTNKLYGLDGSVSPWINDVGGDGTISGSDHVYLYFGMRRGGKNIYALDVTDPDSPGLKWVIKGGTGAYAELGQTWSKPNIEKIKVGGVEKTVLVFGGGYDIDQDTASVRTADDEGRNVYIVDAESGALLWSSRDNLSTLNSSMIYSIPARITTVDVSGDGYMDRMYAADMGGQIFRFDINNTGTDYSITGGLMANLAGSAEADARRFYYPPDVAVVDGPDGKYHGMVISSGYRAHPLNEDIHDRIYMLKDRNTTLITTYPTALTEADLFDVTDNLAGGEGNTDTARAEELADITAEDGWYIDLEDEDNPGSWLGEKGLAEALILEGVAVVTTYTPNAAASGNACQPNRGLGKVYFLDMIDGTAALPSDADSRSDRHQILGRTGIPPSPNVIITEGGEPVICTGPECKATDFGIGVRKTYWYEVEK